MQTGLPEFLGDDFGGSVGIEKAMPHDLAQDSRGAAGALGSAFVVAECSAASLSKGGAELEIALLAVAELGGGSARPQAFTLALNEHGEFGDDFIVRGDGEFTSGSADGVCGSVYVHGSLRYKQPGVSSS